VWKLTGPIIPGILDEKDSKFFKETRNVPEREEIWELTMELMIKAIKEGGSL
jgi:hypothetical protein